jgi:hypothetical protein
MTFDRLNLIGGKWLVANCGKFPSEKNCKLVLMAPENQRGDLLDAIVDHATKCHGHENSNELRKQLDGFLEIIEI